MVFFNTNGCTSRLKSLFFTAVFTVIASFSLSAQTIYALSNATNLLTFSASSPATVTTTAISGVAAGYTVVGLDSRPATGELFALAYRADSSKALLYVINPTSGAATVVGGTAVALTLGTTTNNIGFDFNPTVDRIRVTATNGKNYRLNPVTGGLAATVVETNLPVSAARIGIDSNQGSAKTVPAPRRNRRRGIEFGSGVMIFLEKGS